jgi:branched-chain amino acid aminotransferase
MEKTDKIWMDGSIIDWDQATIHVLSHTLHYGLGVFEGIRCYETGSGPAVFRLEDHVKRMMKGAECCMMNVPFSEKEIMNAVLETLRVNNIKEGYIRPLFFYGYGTMGLNPERSPVRCCIAVWPWGSYLGDQAVKVTISSFMRIHPHSTHADRKICGHYVNSILASCEAEREGYSEAVLLDYQGNIAEGPGENLFIVKDRVLQTPPLGNIIPGITRDSIITLAFNLGYEVKEVQLCVEDLKNADEAFFSGTAAEITPISQIDDTPLPVPCGEITREIQNQFLEIVRGKNERYLSWLTIVK